MKTKYPGYHLAKRKYLLLSCALAALCSSGEILAQPTQTAKVADEDIEFAADQITYDSNTGDVRALGRVKLVRNGYVLEAAEVTYNEKSKKAEASGAVKLQLPTGEVIFAPRVILEDALKDAFVEDIRLLLDDGAQVRAQSAERQEASGLTTLDRAVYSPCKICEEDGGKPTWQIKAVKVVHDRKKRRLYYEDAYLEVLGVPVLWTPYFSHPDPTVDKASGFLPVEIRTSQNLGLVVGTPYYHVFNNSQDLTVTPILTTRDGPVLSSEYRQHLGFGAYTVGGSITYTDERDFNPLTNSFDDTGRNEFRGHITSDGYFNHSENWRSTYRLNYASDDTYLRRYGFSRADTLVSEYLLEGFFDQSYISARTLAFQGLREEDVAGLSAFALPQINAEFIPKFKPLGGTVTLRGNFLALHRTAGLDTQRLSLSANWQKEWISKQGLVFNLDGLLRTDGFNIDNAQAPDEIEFTGTFGSESGTSFREVARLTGRVSLPFIKQATTGYHVLEPVLEFTLAPNSGNPDDLVNEDSRAFELNALNLFTSERAAGFDLIEEGSRLTYGLRWQYEGTDFQTDFLLGQVWRVAGEEVFFADGAGLEGDSSDIISRFSFSYKDWLQYEQDVRLDDRSFDIRRNESRLTLGDDKRGLSVGYLKLDRDFVFINREDREELRTAAYYQISENWRLDGDLIQDLSNGADSVEYNIGVSYIDECIELGLSLRETFTTDRDIEPGTSIQFRLKLKNLG